MNVNKINGPLAFAGGLFYNNGNIYKRGTI